MLTKPNIEKYFFAEKNESILFIVIGVSAILFSVFFFFYFKNNIARGMMIPLIVVGIIQIIVGATVYRKSDKQRIEIIYAFDMNPSLIRNQEIPRMKAVVKNFVVLRFSEIALFAAGLILCIVFRNSATQLFWYGFGIALSIQTFVSLILDFLAEMRAKTYLQQLTEFFST